PRTLSFVIPAGDLRLLFARHPDKGDHQHAPQSKPATKFDPPPPIDAFSPTLCHPERSSTRQCAAQSKDLQPTSIHHRISTPSHPHSVILSGAAHVSVLRTRRTCSQVRSPTTYRRLLTHTLSSCAEQHTSVCGAVEAP